MAQKIVELVLAAAVADDGTVTGIAYPTGTNQAFFTSGNASATGVAIINDNDVWLETATEIGITYGASTITLTNKSGVSWPIGSRVLLALGYATADEVTVIEQPTEAALSLAALSTSDTYTDAALNTQFSAVQTKINAVITKLIAAGVLSAT